MKLSAWPALAVSERWERGAAGKPSSMMRVRPGKSVAPKTIPWEARVHAERSCHSGRPASHPCRRCLGA
eukprot:1791525-Pyramimonas_sp.AAC.1